MSAKQMAVNRVPKRVSDQLIYCQSGSDQLIYCVRPVDLLPKRVRLVDPPLPITQQLEFLNDWDGELYENFDVWYHV